MTIRVHQCVVLVALFGAVLVPRPDVADLEAQCAVAAIRNECCSCCVDAPMGLPSCCHSDEADADSHAPCDGSGRCCHLASVPVLFLSGPTVFRQMPVVAFPCVLTDDASYGHADEPLTPPPRA